MVERVMTRWRALSALVLVVVALGVATTGVRASDGGEASEATRGGVGQELAAAELAERYAPVLMLKEQAAACDASGEPYAPIAVDAVLDHRNVVLRQIGNGDAVLMVAPGAEELFGASAGVYLDYPGDALSPGCIYETDSRRFVERSGATVYAHIAREAGHPDLLALQYWFFWYFNDWNNRHEGDWEGIQLLFEASTVEEALERGPVSVGYAQHEGGEVAAWDGEKLERRGDRPVVYSSAGSHASYFGQAVYLGRSGAEGFGCDVTTAPLRAVDPTVVLLPDAVDDASDPLAWLAYPGRWGEQRGGPLNGPTGPAFKGRWTAPVSWHLELANEGIEVPSGEGFGVEVVEAFCAIAERGSQQWIEAQRNPVRGLLPVVAATVIGLVLVRRASWLPVVPLPLRQRRSIGQILTSSVRVYRRQWREMALIGLAFLPISVLNALLIAVTGGGDRGADDLVGAVLAVPSSVLVGGVGTTLTELLVVSTVAATLADGARQGSRPRWGPYGLVLERWRPLTTSMVRVYAILLGLSVTLIGIPIAIWYGVRYSFVPHAVMIDGLRDGAARERSKELTRGRWIRTAWVVALLGAMSYLIAMAAGLAVLLLVPDLPFWAFSLASSVALALVMPLRAAALALLYGDFAARDDG